MDLRLPHLTTLAAVVRHRSFSKAAVERRLTQPAVSQHVRALETAVGQRLIERVGKRAYPTPAADALLARAARAFEELETARQDLDRLKGTVAGRVRIGTGATASIYLLPQVLGGLRRRYPELEFCVSTGNTPDMVAALLANEIDLAVATLPVPRPRLAVVATCSGPLVAIAPPGHPFAKAGAATPRALAAESLILYESGSATRAVVDRWFQRAHLRPHPAMELANVEAIKRLVAAGLGLSLLPKIAVAQEVRAGALVAIPPKPALARQLGLVHRKDKVLTPALQIALKALAAGLKAPAGA